MHSDHYRKHYRIQFEKLTEKTGQTSITVEQFRNKLSEQKGSLELNDDQIEYLLNVADKDGDERITIEEFENLVTSSAATSSKVKRTLYAIADQMITPAQRVEVHSYLDEYTLCPPPIFILLITLIELGVFLFYLYSQPAGTNVDPWTYCAGCIIGHEPGPFLFAPALREQAWRFASYCLLHAGYSHLLGNLVMQVIVGVSLEVVHKIWRIGPLYMMAVISGALLQYSMDPKVMLVGASAGVYALIMAHLANVVINWSEMPFRWVRIAILSVFLGFDIGGTVYRRMMTDECDQISHAAHIAGGVTGLCFGVFILYNVVEHTWERVVRYVCVGCYVIFLAGIIFLTIYQKPDEKPLWDTAACRND